jgi:putative GTP pyrophosphokinase
MNNPSTFLLDENLDRSKLKRIYQNLHPVYEEILDALHQQVRTVLEENGCFPTIKYRVKRFKTYFDKLIKMSRSGQAAGSMFITDILGLRIVCPFREDLDFVEKLVKAKFTVVEMERKGLNRSVGEFGYESVHFLIEIEPIRGKEELPYAANVCEVQLRTILQDAWAEVEHELIYKSDITLPNESIRRKLAALNATLTLSDLIFQEIRDYQKEIRKCDRKRRQSLDVKMADGWSVDQDLPILQDGQQSAMQRDMDSIKGETNLEKALLAALTAHSAGRLENAVQIYTSILKLKTGDSVRSLVYNHRGMAHFCLSNYAKAISDFSKSIDCDRENVRCYNNRALTYRVLKRYDRSLEDYDRAIALNPYMVDGFWGRAQTLYDMKLYTQSIADCEKALSIKGDFRPAHLLMKRINKLIF